MAWLDPGVWNLEASMFWRGENSEFLYQRFLPPQAQKASPIDCTFNAPYNRYVFRHLYFDHQSPDQNALTIGENSPIYPFDHEIWYGSIWKCNTPKAWIFENFSLVKASWYLPFRAVSHRRDTCVMVALTVIFYTEPVGACWVERVGPQKLEGHLF